MNSEREIINKLNESLEPKDENDTVYSILCNDQEGTIRKILEHLKIIGNTGHSCNIVIDPGTDEEVKYYFDGDGSDKIYEIEVIKAKQY